MSNQDYLFSRLDDVKELGSVSELVSCIFILLSRESDQCAIRARLGVANHLSRYHTKMGESH